MHFRKQQTVQSKFMTLKKKNQCRSPWGKHFKLYIYQIIMLYIYYIIYQLYFKNKMGKKNCFNIHFVNLLLKLKLQLLIRLSRQPETPGFTILRWWKIRSDLYACLCKYTLICKIKNGRKFIPNTLRFW